MTETAAHTVLPGRRLQTARERLGWTEMEVANKLHMSVAFVRAIEADDYERLPEATFIKGYMRNYARLLDIPADEVANLFEQLVDDEVQHESDDPDAEHTPSSGSGGLIVAAAVLAAALLAWLLWPQPQAEHDQPVAQVVLQHNSPASEMAADEMADSSTAPAEPPADAANQSTDARLEPTVSLPASEGSTAAPVADSLLITFSGPCWVQVLDAGGETLFSGQREAGSDLTLTGEAPFRLTFGNGAAVASVAVNGETVTLPQSTPGNVVRVRAP